MNWPSSIATLLLLLLGSQATAPTHVWWEAEDPVETSFPERTWLSGSTFEQTRHEILSGGAWLTHAGERDGEPPFARYEIQVPEPGRYSLWVRKFWKHGPFRWRFDRRGWRECGRDIGLADSVSIREHLCVNWVALGAVELGKGEHRFELELLAGKGEQLTAGFDCFLLTREPFTPRGRLKPGERSGKSEPGYWAVEPTEDPGPVVLDLRELNEKVAGQSGFVGRTGGESPGFLLGDGTPVRFWGVNCGPGIVKLERETVDALVRRLARVGVNLVRIHGAVHDASSSELGTIDEEYLDRLHYFVAALKREGIYSELSFYFPLWVNMRPSYGVRGYEKSDNQHPFGLLFFEPKVQAAWRALAHALLTTRNPYTKKPLAKDPAIALIELQNEDSLFFWTFNPGATIPVEAIEPLERKFASWLEARHGSLAAAVDSWGEAKRERDELASGRVELLPIWNLTGDGHLRGGTPKRSADQLRFLTETMREFYAESIEYLRGDVGCRSLVACGNWHTADPRVLEPLERYTYTAGDVIDQHGYFGGQHEGNGASYSVRVGHTFADRSAILEPEAVPWHFREVVGFPQICSEIGWPNPNRYKAEWPVLCATYGSLQGLDGCISFAVNGPSWSAASEKFQLDVPSVLGQFPGYALVFRRGDVSESPPVFREVLDLEELLAFRGEAEVDPRTFFAGRVQRSFDPAGGGAIAEHQTGVDEKARRITSLGEELEWDWGRGLITMDTPRAQGACGFLARAGAVELGDLRIECNSEFASILVVSLDDEPLATSSKILIQAATEEKPYGWRAENGRIESLGGYPLLVREVEARVTLLSGARFGSACACDIEGRRGAEVAFEREGEVLSIELPRAGIYTLLEVR